MNNLNVFRMEKIFTAEQLQKITELFSDEDAVRRIHAEVILPNLDQINERTGQQNDPMYIAYACVYVMSGIFAEDQTVN
jgi:hypothetical protein